MVRLSCIFCENFLRNHTKMCSLSGSMQRDTDTHSTLKSRLLYGAVVGAFLGMFIGTMPGNEPLVGLISMGLGAAVIASLAAASNHFWESLRAAWELVRISFWRW